MKITTFFSTLLLVLTIGADAATAAPLKVVASFSILGDLASAVGGQRIELRVSPDLHWDAPWEVVEALLANLLLNAIQHGGEGAI